RSPVERAAGAPGADAGRRHLPGLADAPPALAELARGCDAWGGPGGAAIYRVGVAPLWRDSADRDPSSMAGPRGRLVSGADRAWPLLRPQGGDDRRRVQRSAHMT